MQQTTTDAARMRRAGFDRQRVSHLRLEPNPALVHQQGQRAQSIQSHPLVRVLERVRLENYPYGLLTMIVSLEAIFLSTFVMISQNRADRKRQAIADQQWQTVKEEDRQNEELLELSRQILELTKAIHAVTTPRTETVEATRYPPVTEVFALARPSTGPC
jgi:hypothetical protein